MLELISPPELEPVTYAQLLAHLRVEPFDESVDESSQEYVNRIIATVRKEAEAFTNRAFITQTWKYYLQSWSCSNFISIPKPPLISATVKYTDIGGTQSTLSSTVYTVDTKSTPGRIVLNPYEIWPTDILFSSNPIEIEFVCGYGPTPEDVEAAIRHAILIAAGDLWDNRDEFREKLPKTSERLLYPYIVWAF